MKGIHWQLQESRSSSFWQRRVILPWARVPIQCSIPPLLYQVHPAQGMEGCLPEEWIAFLKLLAAEWWFGNCPASNIILCWAPGASCGFRSHIRQNRKHLIYHLHSNKEDWCRNHTCFFFSLSSFPPRKWQYMVLTILIDCELICVQDGTSERVWLRIKFFSLLCVSFLQ